jgi:outer membrane protein assembly factor BamB
LALIELDLTIRPDQTPSPPPPAYRYRLPGLIIAAVLLLLLGGAAPDVPRLWQHVGSVPLTGEDSPFTLAGGEIYTVTSSGGTRTATAWLLTGKPGRLWSTSFPARTVLPDEVGFTRVEAERAGDVVLVHDGPGTTALDARTGKVRWSVRVPVSPLDGGNVGVTQVQQFRPGTLYDQDSGDPGALYFSSTGQPHTEPPLRTEVHGVDLTSGATVWSVPESGSVNVLRSADDREVLILSSDRLEQRDASTGRIRRQLPLTPIDGTSPTGGDIIGDTLLVSYGPFGGQEIAYAPSSLKKLWSRAVPAILLDPPSCGDVLCDGGRSDLDVLDKNSGKPLWRAPADVDLSLRDGYVVESDSGSGLLLRLVDPDTGRTRVDLGGWRAEAIATSGRPILLRAGQGAKTVFAVVERRRDAVQPLGEISGAVGDCAADSAHVVCRTDHALQIWAYRA